MSARSTNSAQLTLDFEPGLNERYKRLLDCVRSCAYSNRSPLKAIASDMDLSESELSRKLNEAENDTRRFNLHDLEKFLHATGDLTPIYWLIERFLTDEDARQKRAMAELIKQMPQIMALIKSASSASQ